MVKNELALNAGVIFERAFDVLYSQMNNAIPKLIGVSNKSAKEASLDAALFVAIVVNGALACELYLKSLLSDETRTHKLDKIYGLLEISEQEEIKKRTIANMRECTNEGNWGDEQFYINLSSVSNAFVKWRYFYEGGAKTASLEFIKAFMSAIREVSYTN